MLATRLLRNCGATAASRAVNVTQSSAQARRSVTMFAIARPLFAGCSSLQTISGARKGRNGTKTWKWAFVSIGAAMGYAGVGGIFWFLERDSMTAFAKAKPVKLVPSRELHGKWKKVEEVGQEKALLQMSLNWVFRQAATLLTNLEICVDEEAIQIVTQGGLVIQITEKYGFDGGEYECSRRDNRSGKHVGKIVEATPSKVVLNITWNDPHGGEMFETFDLIEDGKLKQTTCIKVNHDASTGQPGEWYTYYSIFTRQ